MKIEDVRRKSLVELDEELLRLLKIQFSLKFQHATQQLSNTSDLRTIRRDIARVKCIMNERKGA